MSGALVNWSAMAEQVLAGNPINREQARQILEAPDEEVPAIVAAAYKLRHHHWGKQVHLHLLMNAQSGLCPEDCGYCSQSSVSDAEIEKYPMHQKDTILAGANRAAELGCSTYCIVMSGRGPNDKAVDELAEAVTDIKSNTNLKVCACLGLLRDDQATKLKAAGVDRYNHNLNTSREHTPNIVATHTYDDRVETVENVKAAGISPCSGAIFGMQETLDDRVAVAFNLQELDVDSIPVNFLHPIEGTPLGDTRELTPNDCLKALAMMRFVNPSKEIRVAGGREVNLRSLQAMGLYIANSIFLGDYLTTEGQDLDADYKMIEDLGFEVAKKAIPMLEQSV